MSRKTLYERLGGYGATSQSTKADIVEAQMRMPPKALRGTQPEARKHLNAGGPRRTAKRNLARAPVSWEVLNVRNRAHF